MTGPQLEALWLTARDALQRYVAAVDAACAGPLTLDDDSKASLSAMVEAQQVFAKAYAELVRACTALSARMTQALTQLTAVMNTATASAQAGAAIVQVLTPVLEELKWLQERSQQLPQHGGARGAVGGLAVPELRRRLSSAIAATTSALRDAERLGMPDVLEVATGTLKRLREYEQVFSPLFAQLPS